jgi:Rod binding domain-containing protein
MAQTIVQPRAFTPGPRASLTPPSAAGQHEKILAQAQKWVAQTFFGTLLKQVRESPFKSKLFDGGRGGEAFGALFDQHIAEHMARGSGQKLVNAIARRIEANSAYRKSAKSRSSDRPRTTSIPLRSTRVPANLRA